MSHHFDGKTARENPSLNILDMYLFPGQPGHTTMAMTVNADVGISTPDILHDEGLDAFRFDLDGDGHEEVAFKFRFGLPRHAPGDDHRHVQSFQVFRAEGNEIGGDRGQLLIEGETGTAVADAAVRAFAGTKPEMWAADAVAFFNLLQGLYKDNRFASEAFLHQKNFFRGRNVTSLVLEVPTQMIGHGKVGAWATASLYGHAPEVQVYRWGLPLFTHLFLSDPTTSDLLEKFHTSIPADDERLFGRAVARLVVRLSQLAGSTVDPEEYGRQIARRLCPTMLPYVLGTEATFGLDAFNGRPLNVDAYDVMLTLAAKTPIADGVAPDSGRIQDSFPYYGEPFSNLEQENYVPLSRGFYDS